MGVDVKKLKEKFDRKNAERADRLKLQDGENYLRLLPPSLEYLAEQVDYISVDFPMHYKLGIEGNLTQEICPKVQGKQHRCPVCEAVFKLYATKDPTDKELAGRIRAKMRHTYNVIDLNNVEKGVQILETGPQLYAEVIEFVANPKYCDILDLDKGRNVTITKVPEKESSTGYVQYKFIPDPDITSIKESLPKNWKESIAKLKSAVPVPKTYEELKKILEGEEIVASSESENDADPVEEVVAPVVAPATKKAEVKPATTEKPQCFGNDFGPKKEECIGCSVKITCREEYLKID
jgi:hypothetical protein